MFPLFVVSFIVAVIAEIRVLFINPFIGTTSRSNGSTGSSTLVLPVVPVLPGSSG
jgi:hypothetical protein